jgi:lipopolysaccharide export system protein LptC
MWVQWVRRALLALSLILAFSLAYVLATKTDPGSASVERQSALKDRADAGIDQFTFTQSKDGAVQWKVEAQRARVFEHEKQAVLEDVQVTLFGRKGWELKLAGDEGKIDTEKRNFLLAKRDGVMTIEFESGYTVYTNHLAWADARREISTGDQVRIMGHGLEITGQGFEGKLDKEEFRILNDVHVEIRQ